MRMHAASGWIAALLVPCSAWLSAAVAAPPTDAEVLAGADERIEKHRKADVELVLLLPDDKPAAGVDVKIEQTRHAFLFGSNVFKLNGYTDKAENESYAKHFAALLNFATVPFYWWGYEVKQGEPQYAKTEKMVAWCREHGITVKGHPLAWNYVDPKWLPDDDPKAVAKLQFQRITDCVTRFRGKIDMWDVVNEATEYARPGLLHDAPKLTAAMKDMGVPEYVRAAFVAARKANPKATLLINDYITDDRYVNDVIAKLVDDKGKKLYDVIGIQCHQHGGAWGPAKTWAICERFAKFGVPLHFTEATLLSGELGWDLAKSRKDFDWASTPEGEARQAKEVVEFYTALFSHPAVEAITWWDFADKHSWQSAPAGFLRRDLTPKPSYEKLMGLIKDKWWTRTTARTDNEGRVRFRGFYGQYEIAFAVDGKKVVKTFKVEKGEDNKVRLRAAP